VTGLRYFGKSIKQDIVSYLGSGKEWRLHIKQHGKHLVEHEWSSDWFYSKAEVKAFARAFSEIFDIVNSTEWANGMIENGTSGGPLPKEKNYFYNNPFWAGKNRPWTEEQYRKQSIIQKTTFKYKRTLEHNALMSDRVKEAFRRTPRVRVTCPHCNKQGTAGNMTRWHFNNCKYRDLV
jgi:hypothetical protein